MARCLAALLALATFVVPLVTADYEQGIVVNVNHDTAPQIACELLQTAPRPASDPLRCNVTGTASGINLLRIRIVGPGHVFAYARDESRTTQLVQFETTGATYTNAAKPFFPASSLSISLHAFLDGPAAANALVWVEKLGQDLP